MVCGGQLVIVDCFTVLQAARGGMEEPEFRVFIRIPAPRPPGFVDPPSFVWNAEKERTLWKVISRRTRGDINCHLPSRSLGCCRGADVDRE